MSAIEDLLMAAAEDASAGNLDKLLAALKKADKTDTDEFADQLELVFEEFEDDMSEAQAYFCLELARGNVKDGPVFRKALTGAIKRTLPPYLNKLSFLRALGLRDRDVPLREIILRYENMLRLKNNMQIFFEGSKRWGIVSDIDAVSGSVAVNSPTGGAFAVPLNVALSEGRVFESSAPAAKLARFMKTGNFSGADYRVTAREKSLVPLDDNDIERIAYATAVPGIMNSDEFRKWWSAGSGAAKQSNEGRQFFEARSLQELHILLGGDIDENFKLDDAAAEKLAAFFTRLKPAAAAREAKILAELVAMLFPYGGDEQLRQIFRPLAGKAPFWPESLETVHLELLNVWGTVPAKHIPNIARAMSLIFPPEYLAAYTTCLPLRCLSAFGEIIDDDLLYDAVRSLHMCNCDILLWIWRDRNKHDKELLELLSIEQVAKALSVEDLPKAWTGAQRDLKQMLMDKKDFQKHLIELVGENIWVITSILQTAAFCNSSERQSLLIKLARLSPELREHLEGGAGQRALGSRAVQDSVPGTEPLFTSVKSHRALLDELQTLVNVHIPENREALKAARAHGDFRENAEYDAAKERRNFLNRRRDELERDILLVQPLDFEKVIINEYSDVGSAVTLKSASGEERYFLVGAWDGNPDENMISYKTRMGRELMHHKAGDEIKLPNGTVCTIAKVEKLPGEIIAKLKA
ncbi:MAG: GreA/GreB family elongation factor [Victivallaceae bacterium]|nr:GreA/GreB family elongation factor [Victivallaceae bacterium]